MKVTNDKVVTVEYSLKDNNNIVIDSSEISGPFTYVHGHEQTLEGMEDILLGQEEDFIFDGVIPCEKAYGKKDKEFFMPVPKSEFENIDDLKVGMSLAIINNYDESQDMEIISIDDTTVTIDANSPYADMDIKFTCKVLEIRDATEEELAEAAEEEECGCGIEGDHDHHH